MFRRAAEDLIPQWLIYLGLFLALFILVLFVMKEKVFVLLGGGA